MVFFLFFSLKCLFLHSNKSIFTVRKRKENTRREEAYHAVDALREKRRVKNDAECCFFLSLKEKSEKERRSRQRNRQQRRRKKKRKRRPTSSSSPSPFVACLTCLRSLFLSFSFAKRTGALRFSFEQFRCFSLLFLHKFALLVDTSFASQQLRSTRSNCCC